MSTAAWLLVAASILPWLALEAVFFLKMRRRHGAAAQPPPPPPAEEGCHS